jgi:CheY-like chemotaxis protein/anti-sigma regulatory factor (Ser/Thr protein kinase)
MVKILVVDDSAMDRHLAGKLLEKRGADWQVTYAEDGRQGLAALERERLDLIVSDMQMPELNGLELVTEVRARWPLVPVILMTAHGSEDVAIAALKKGAASYVPKRDLARDLAETVEKVLALATAERDQQKLRECLLRTETEFVLYNDPSLIPTLIAHLRRNLEAMSLCDETGLIRVTVALGEALTNAMVHGNLEIPSGLREGDGTSYRQMLEERGRQRPYRDRKVRVHAREEFGEARYMISDEGHGFDPSGLPDPTDPANLEKASGRGLFLIRTFMDEVYHNETGNEITMVKRRDW